MGAVIDLAHGVVGDRPVGRATARILEPLVKARGGLVRVDRLIDALWHDDPDGGPLDAPNALRLQIYRARRELAGTGYEIRNRVAQGYRLHGLPPHPCPCCGREMPGRAS